MTFIDDQDTTESSPETSAEDRVDLLINEPLPPFKPRTPDRALGVSLLISLAFHGGILAIIVWACLAVVPPSAAVMSGVGGPGGTGAVVTWHDQSAGSFAAVSILADRAPEAPDEIPADAPQSAELPDLEVASALNDTGNSQPRPFPIAPDPPSLILLTSWMGTPPARPQTGPPIQGVGALNTVGAPDRAGAGGSSGGTGSTPISGGTAGNGRDGQYSSTAGGIDGDDNRGDGLGEAPTPGARNRPPRYPAEARQKGIEGTVVLELDIRSDGRVAAVRIAASSGSDLLDGAAIDGLKHWIFNPAKSNGQPIQWRITQPVEFHLHAADQPN